MPSVPPVLSSNVVSFPSRQSFGKRVDLLSGGVFDVVRRSADFPELWMAFLRGAFPGVGAVAYHFGISERAAEKWWNGIGGPRGDKVMIALITVPGAPRALLGCDLVAMGRAA